MGHYLILSIFWGSVGLGKLTDSWITPNALRKGEEHQSGKDNQILKVEEKQPGRPKAGKPLSKKEISEQKGRREMESGEVHDRFVVIKGRAIEIRGYLSLKEVERMTGVPIDYLIKQTDLPINVDVNIQMGRLKRRYDDEIVHKIRDAISNFYEEETN